MAGDNRGTTSLFRRHEQLRRWQESETNKQELAEKIKKARVKFSDGCIFLAAAAAGDKDELKRLLDRGADINTVNQDGITALHAACIDNNLEIVEFLVDNGADINQCDMEGWTPLHATSSCGYLTMAKFLIDREADLSVVNNDGELAFDVVDQDDVARLLQEEMEIRGIDCDASRSREERRMLEDAQYWYNLGYIDDSPHSKTGATALHVAAAKGYIKVLRLLIQTGADVNAKDLDGWTPLHASAHWGQNEVVEILCDSMADMDIVNHVGQTPYDLSDEMMKRLMDELKRKQESIKLKNKSKLPKKRKTSPQVERSKKKEKDSQRSDSEGTSSSDESASDVDKRTISNRVDSSVGQSEIQSWRRPSLLSKTIAEEKDKEQAKTIPNSTPHINSNEDGNHVKDDRNCQDILRGSESMPNVSSTSPTRPTSRTFAPPSRDDESETQRKAHAKMIRSTRRSTQGITLEDVKSAEQLMKNKQPSDQPASSQGKNAADKVNSLVNSEASSHVDHSSFSLEDTRPKGSSSNTEDLSLSSLQRRKEADKETDKALASSSTPTSNSSSTTLKTTTTTASVTTSVGSTSSTMNAASAREATSSAAIQRKKKPKRRSTGVVHVDMDEIDPERKTKDSRSDEEESEDQSSSPVSINEKDGKSGRSISRSSSVGPDNGQIDYKKLYEEQVVENDRLMNRLRSYEKELRHTREAMDTNNKMNSARSAMAESDRREKRSLERKLSEMEEELKELEQLRQENQRLRDENGALIRVISKLSR